MIQFTQDSESRTSHLSAAAALPSKESVFLFQSVGKLISEGAPPRRRGGAGGTHASPPSGVPGWEGGHKNTSPRGSLCAVCESLKTHSSEMLWQSARVRVDLHVSTWGSFSDLSSWRISPVVEALIPTARRRQHLIYQSRRDWIKNHLKRFIFGD